MSKIKDARGRKDGNSGYTRVVGNAELGQLLSRVQATVISNGSELERMIAARSTLIEDIDVFIEQATTETIASGVYLCLKKIFKLSKRYAKGVKGLEPDMLIFVIENYRNCKVIELKDGDMFDTKKVIGEKQHLEDFSTIFGAKIPFVTDYYICSFNQEDKNIIYTGFKGCFEIEHILTGRELCEILKIDYDEIRHLRAMDEAENFRYLISEMCKIPEVAREIKKYIE